MHFRCFLTLTALLLACGSIQAAGPNGIQTGQPLNDGGQLILDDNMAQAIADTGAGWVRVNFRLANNSSDTAQWYSIYDGIVDRLRSRGLRIIGNVTDECCKKVYPADNPSANSYELTGGNGQNAYLDNWCATVLRFATHWQGKVNYWELWNEPDCLAVIKPSNFGYLLAHTYDLIHTNNVQVQLISGGLCTGGQDWGNTYLRNTYDVSINHTGWFKQMKDKWGTYPLDHIGYHQYPNPTSAINISQVSSLLDGVRSAYTDYEGLNTPKKIFITEWGWQTSDVSDALQASNLTAYLNLINSKPYVMATTWFFIQDIPPANPPLYYGLLRSGGLSDSYKKPAWTNMKTACTYEGRRSAGGSVIQTILDYFNTQGHAAVGNPYDNGSTAWAHDWDYGYAQDYDGGTLGKLLICDSANWAAYSVRGDFLAAMQANHAALEFPLCDQFTLGSTQRQNFEGGYVSWTASGGAQVTLYPNKVIVDNSDPGFSVSSSWSSFSGYVDANKGNGRKRLGTATNSDPATWTIAIPQAGYYDVYTKYPTVSGATTNAIYEVQSTSGTSTVSVNQKLRPGRWNRLGSYQFNAGNAVVRLWSQAPTTDYVIADAVRVVGPVTGPPTVPVVTDDGAYTPYSTQIHATWQSSDPNGIDHYEYAVGTSPADPGNGYTVPWTNAGAQTSVVKQVTLTQSATYFIYVRAYNPLGMMSQGASDGITVDATGPSKPILTDDGDYTGDPSQLHCSWSATDSESGIVDYTYAIGTQPYVTDVVRTIHVGTATQAWAIGLNLTAGKTYYFTVTAKNGSGFVSASAVSNGIRYDPSYRATSIADALSQPDQTKVLLKGRVVSALFGDRFYIEETDRSAGIAVLWPLSVQEGSMVDVTGLLQTSAGERRLAPGCVTPLQQN